MLARLRSLRVEDPDEQRGVFGLVRGEGARPDLARVAPEPEAGRGGPRGHLARAPLAVLPLPDDLEARFQVSCPSVVISVRSRRLANQKLSRSR